MLLHIPFLFVYNNILLGYETLRNVAETKINRS